MKWKNASRALLLSLICWAGSAGTAFTAITAEVCDMPVIQAGSVETCTSTDGIHILTKVETTFTRTEVSPNVFDETGEIVSTFGGTGTVFTINFSGTFDEQNKIDSNIVYTVISNGQTFSGTCQQPGSSEPGCAFVDQFMIAEDGAFSGSLEDLEEALNAAAGFTAQTVIQTTETVIAVQDEVQSVVTKEQTRSANQIISNRISNAVGGFMRSQFRMQSTLQSGVVPTYAQAAVQSSGLAAGDERVDKGLWVDASKAFIDIDRTASRADGNSMTVLVGMDRFFTEDVLVGGLLGGLKSDIDLKSLNGKQETIGTLFGIYGAWLLDRNWTLEGNATYTKVENDVDRTSGNVRITSFYDSDRYSLSGALNGYRVIDQWYVTTGIGGSFTREKADGYTDSSGTPFPGDTLEIGIVNGMAEAAYGLTDLFEPYVSAAYEYELTDPEAGGKDTLILGAGFRYQPHQSLSLGGSVTTQTFRSKEKVTTVGLNARLQF